MIHPISSLNISNLTSTDSQLTPVISTTPTIHSFNDYIQKISDSIEKFCVNTFENINLTNTVDYEIHLNILDTKSMDILNVVVIQISKLVFVQNQIHFNFLLI